MRPLYKPVTDVNSFVVVGTTATINLNPPVKHKWLLDYVTVSHNGAAARVIVLSILGVGRAAGIIMELAEESVPANTEVIAYPVFHKIDANPNNEHDHILSTGDLILEKDIRKFQVKGIGMVAGEILTVRHTYRRVL